MTIDLEDGKYTIHNDNGILTLLRHGQPWPGAASLTSSGLVLALVHEVERLRTVPLAAAGLAGWVKSNDATRTAVTGEALAKHDAVLSAAVADHRCRNDVSVCKRAACATECQYAHLAPPLLPDGAVLHAQLQLNHNGQIATCECTGDPRPSIQQLIEECSK